MKRAIAIALIAILIPAVSLAANQAGGAINTLYLFGFLY